MIRLGLRNANERDRRKDWKDRVKVSNGKYQVKLPAFEENVNFELLTAD